MKESNLLLGISLDIDGFKEYLKRISKDGYKLHELDKDLLLQKTRILYDNILKLETAVEEEDFVLPEPEDKNILPQMEAVESDHEIKIETEVFDSESETVELEFQEPEQDNFENETVDEEIKDVLFEEQKTETEEKIEEEIIDNPENLSKQEPHLDLFSTEQETISDRFVSKEEKSLADKLQQTKLNDLRSAIGINEKFLFINELFGGDMGRYNRILDELNSMQSKTGIDTFFMELKIERQWNEEEETFVKFKNLVDRKFD